MQRQNDECCPEFDPAPWDDKEQVWDNRLFVRDRVQSFLHIPLNFGKVMTRCVSQIEAADAKPESMLVLSDENSLWGADIHIEATHEVPDAQMARLSGTFLSRVFEGPYSQMGQWIKSMKTTLAEKSLTAEKIYTYYTTCPKCAKKFGRNYVVLLARIR